MDSIKEEDDMSVRKKILKIEENKKKEDSVRKKTQKVERKTKKDARKKEDLVAKNSLGQWLKKETAGEPNFNPSKEIRRQN